MAYVKDLIKHAWVVAMATLLIHLSLTEAFEYSAYCESQCKIGRGGNLCKCNAVHFAGKRTMDVNIQDPAYNSLAEDREPGLYEGGKREEIVRLLSYLINPEHSSKQVWERDGGYAGEVQGEAGDNGEVSTQEKRFGSAAAIPYRNWYRDMKNLMKAKLSRDV